MKIPQFAAVIFQRQPRQLVLASGLFLLSGVLEFLSIAAFLPVLLELIRAGGDAGMAGQIMAVFGLDTLTLGQGIALILILMGVRGVLTLMAEYFVGKLSQDQLYATRTAIFDSMINSRWAYLLGFDKGRITNLVLRESGQYAQAIIQLGNLLAAVVICGVMLAAAVFVSWQAFAIFVLALVPYVLLAREVNKRIRKNSRAQIGTANRLGAQIGESAAHLKYIKAAALEETARTRFMHNARDFAHYALRIVIYKGIIKHFPEIFGIAILGGLIWLARAYLGQNPADILFFMLLLFRGYKRFATIQNVRANLVQRLPAYQICDELIQDAAQHEEKLAHKQPPPAKITHIAMRDVCFSYGGQSDWALRDVNLDIPATGAVALVGATGAGKTTLADILLGLMLPESGDVIINDDVRLSDVDLRRWRRAVGYVPQEAFLVSGTVRQNILLGADDASDENLRRAGRIAHIDGFVNTLENGYDTQVGDYGVRLSGGQKQRIALARALAGKPELLILDEATSALDNQTEADIQGAIADIAADIPVVIIAHRLSTIRNADTIYVMEQGEVVEQGGYETLMAKQGAFWRLNNAAAEAA